MQMPENFRYKETLRKGPPQHAMYDDFGKDIVCSSVSSIVITTVNAIERIDNESISYTEVPFSLRILNAKPCIVLIFGNFELFFHYRK